MLFLLALVSVARAAISQGIVKHLYYDHDDADCSGQIMAVQESVQDLGTCENDADDGEPAEYEKYTCNADTADSTVLYQNFGETQCDMPGATSTDVTLTPNECVLLDDDRQKLLFNCADGSASTVDTSGMIRMTMSFYLGTSCTGVHQSSLDQTSYYRPDVCVHSSPNEWAIITCVDGTITETLYVDSACTTEGPGGGTLSSACTDFDATVSYRIEIAGCDSAAAELTIFGLALLALFRF